MELNKEMTYEALLMQYDCAIAEVKKEMARLTNEHIMEIADALGYEDDNLPDYDVEAIDSKISQLNQKLDDLSAKRENIRAALAAQKVLGAIHSDDPVTTYSKGYK